MEKLLNIWKRVAMAKMDREELGKSWRNQGENCIQTGLLLSNVGEKNSERTMSERKTILITHARN